MSLAERYSPETLDEITSMHPADARAVFALLVNEEDDSLQRHTVWAQKPEVERAENWAIKMADTYEQALSNPEIDFSAHWHLGDRHHQRTFRMFHDLLNLSWEDLNETWQLIDERDGVGLFGKVTLTSPENDEISAYECVWYKTLPLQEMGGLALRGNDYTK